MSQDRRSLRVDACVADLESIVASDLTDREKRHLLRNRMRGMTGRIPRWTSDAALAAGASERHVDEHVVPLRFLAGRLLAGADALAMLSVADVTCRVSRDEDQRVSYVGTQWPDLEKRLTSAKVGAAKLTDLGWERYRRAEVAVQFVGHRNAGRPLLAKEPCPCGSGGAATRCCSAIEESR